MQQFESPHKIGDSVYVDLYGSGVAGNATVTAVKFTDNKVYYDVKVALIPVKASHEEVLKRDGFSVDLKEIDSCFVKAVEYEHADVELGIVKDTPPVDDGSIQDAVVVEAE